LPLALALHALISVMPSPLKTILQEKYKKSPTKPPKKKKKRKRKAEKWQFKCSVKKAVSSSSQQKP
jgi:hypothetical protein